MKKHGERAHSKFSASGSERYFNCPGSVELSEGLPDKDSKWSLEGTEAHEILEAFMRVELSGNDGADVEHATTVTRGKPKEMITHARNTADFILGIHYKEPDSEALAEIKIHLDFIHPEMFGTFDGSVAIFFDTLHVFDFKYGAGVPVSPVKNLQLIFYAIGLAHKYNWNFKKVRLWIIQPRIKGYTGPVFWDVPILELKRYVPQFEKAVQNVLDNPKKYVEGDWCHWCKARSVCPKKLQSKLAEAREIFSSPKGGDTNGKKEKEESGALKSEADWRQEKARKKVERAKGRQQKARARVHTDNFY